MRRVIIIFYLFASGEYIHAQKMNSENSDSLSMHSAKKAILLSTFIPGAGQIYNHISMPKGKRKAFWKVPLIYACLGTTSYFLIQNQKTQKALKTDYMNRQEGELPDPRWQQFDDEGILTLYNQHLTKRDLSILGVGLVYLVQVVDAGIEAHFVDFDISRDLSLKILPTLISASGPGMKLKLNFN